MIRTNFQTTFPTAKWLWTVLLAFFSLVGTAQKELPPPSDRLVNDYAGMLSANEVRALEEKLVAYDDSTSTQIAIVIERSLDGADIFDYSFRLAEHWGIGQSENDNGILIYVASLDRKVRIQTGYGTEGFLPDAMAKRIIENVIIPAFRQQQYYQGLDRATDIIISLAKGEYQGMGRQRKPMPIGLILFLIVLILIVIIVINRNEGGGGGYYRGGRYDHGRGGWIIFGPGSGGGGWHSGGGGGFGGGGFGGFGGGGFGGGGAGGSW